MNLAPIRQRVADSRQPATSLHQPGPLIERHIEGPPASAAMAVPADSVGVDRSSSPDVRNPLLKLPAAADLANLADGDRRELRTLLDELRRAARAQADRLWARRKARDAAYWRACSVYAGHAARIAYPRSAVAAGPTAEAGRDGAADYRGPNPLLSLPAAAALRSLPATTRSVVRALLLQLRSDAIDSSINAWSKSKSPMAAYWADVATFAGDAARFMRDRIGSSHQPGNHPGPGHQMRQLPIGPMPSDASTQSPIMTLPTETTDIPPIPLRDGRAVRFTQAGDELAQQMATIKVGSFAVSEIGVNAKGSAFCIFVQDVGPDHPAVRHAVEALVRDHDVVSLHFAHGQPVAEHPQINTLGAPNLRHPYEGYDVADAVHLATSIAGLQLKPPPSTLVAAREVIRDEATRVDHVWLTGACALDVLDAVIDGVDLTQQCRLLPGEAPAADQRLRAQRYA